MIEEIEDRDSLSLTFDAPVHSARDLIDAIASLTDLADEVAKSLVRDVKIQWQVESISMHSPLQLRMKPVAPRNRPADLHELSPTVVRWLTEVQSGGPQPARMNDEALKHAKRLAKLVSTEGRTLSVRTSSSTLEVTTMLGAQVDELRRTVRREYGAVEGFLQMIDVHTGTDRFAVYDRFTHKGVNCSMSETVSLEDVANALRKRVMVEGDIEYQRTGHINRITVRKLYVFPDSESLPTFEDIRGIYT